MNGYFLAALPMEKNPGCAYRTRTIAGERLIQRIHRLRLKLTESMAGKIGEFDTFYDLHRFHVISRSILKCWIIFI